MENFEQIQKEYLEKYISLSQKEKAVYEHRIWDLWILDNKEEKPRRVWFADRFAGSQSEYDMRSALLSVGKDVDVLWERLNKDMTLHTATQLTRQAKKLHVNGKSFGELVNSVLVEYDNRPSIRCLPNGKVAKATPSEKRTPPKNSNEIAKVNGAVRDLVHDFAAKELVGLDSYETKVIKEELFDWINDGLYTFARKLLKLRGDTKEERIYVKIGKSRFNESLELLGLKVSDYSFGKKHDFKKVKKAYLGKMSVLHPDKNPGNERIAHEFDLVNKAFKILEEYNEQF